MKSNPTVYKHKLVQFISKINLQNLLEKRLKIKMGLKIFSDPLVTFQKN
jgi:hypothetical protein